MSSKTSMAAQNYPRDPEMIFVLEGLGPIDIDSFRFEARAWRKKKWDWDGWARAD